MTQQISQSPASQSGGTGKRMLALASLVLGLNYAFNELMDESGLHFAIVTGTLPTARQSATEVALFRLHAIQRSDSWRASNSSLVRSELLKLKHGAHVYAFVTVGRQEVGADATAAAIAAGVKAPTAPEHYRTVFPERARWLQHKPIPEDGMHAAVGDLELLAQHLHLTVAASRVDELKQSWIDLGYNSLGEAGVVRCDLLQHASEATIFLARKVFRGQRALEAHEASEHYLRWRSLALSDGEGSPLVATQSVQLLNTLHPRSSPQPFASGWKTI